MLEDYQEISLAEEKILRAPAVTAWRLTAMWGFSEAAFGGILHAFKIPFTGIFVGGAAVIFISLIAYYSPNKTQIIKSTFVVLLIKGMVSPHTPITAHLAVLMQGLIGQALFYSRSYYKTSAFILGVVTLLLSGMQKIIIVTLVFGNTISVNCVSVYDITPQSFGSPFTKFYCHFRICSIPYSQNNIQ